MGNHNKLLHFLRPDPVAAAAKSDDDDDSSSSPVSGCGSVSPSPYNLSPWNPAAASPFAKSPWTHLPGLADADKCAPTVGLLCSLVKEEGHIYSLAAAGEMLYTGTDSKNIRVWKDRREFAGFKSGSGLVKAIIVAGDGRIFTGHQDGKIRVWRSSPENPAVHKRVGSLPRLKDFLKSSINPANYVVVRRHRNAVWLRHFDAVSCLSLDDDASLLYSGSWDKTFKVWRVSDSKCLESIRAHDDAVNTVAAAGFDSMVFSGSADGTVKVWQREMVANGATKHFMMTTLRQGESAVTAIEVAREDRVVYCGSSDGAVNYWQWRRGAARHGGVLRGHKMAVLCIAAAGPVVVSGSADRTLCVWRREESEHVRLAVLSGHTGPVKCVTIDEDEVSGAGGDRRWVVYSGSLDGSVKVWRVSDAEAPARGDHERQRMAKSTPPPSQVWAGQTSPLHVWPPYQTPELKRVAAAYVS